MFVGGALAITGLKAIFNLLSIDSADGTRVFVFALIVGGWTCFALPIGIAILIGHKRSVRWAFIYLWLVLALAIFAVVGPYVFRALIANFKYEPLSLLHSIRVLVLPAALLWLLALSRSERFHKDQNFE